MMAQMSLLDRYHRLSQALQTAQCTSSEILDAERLKALVGPLLPEEEHILLNMLACDGWIDLDASNHWYPTIPRTKARRAFGFMTDVQHQPGLSPTVRRLILTPCHQVPSWAQPFANPSRQYWCYRTVQCINDKPVAVSESYLPDHLGITFFQNLDDQMDLYDQMHRVNANPQTCDEWIDICNPPGDVAELLELPQDLWFPVFRIRRIVWGENEHDPWEICLLHDRVDAYELHYRFSIARREAL